MLRGLLFLLGNMRIFRMVIGLMMDRRVPLRLKLVIPAAVAYLILPIDIVPDILPLLGRTDDVLVLLLSVGVFLAFAPRDVVMEHLRGTGVGSAGGRNGSDSRRPDSNVIAGSYRLVDDDQERSC